MFFRIFKTKLTFYRIGSCASVPLKETTFFKTFGVTRKPKTSFFSFFYFHNCEFLYLSPSKQGLQNGLMISSIFYREYLWEQVQAADSSDQKVHINDVPLR